MSKIAIVGDLHIGIRDDDQWIQDYQRKFFKYLDEYCTTNSIETIFQLGDWFDVRRGLSQDTLHFQRTFIDPIMSKYSTYVIVGNHDAHLRENLHPNSCTEVLASKPQYHVIEDVETINVYGIDFDFIPWICNDNREQIHSHINNSKSEYALMHAELNGFEFHKGQKATGCDDPQFLKTYKQVWSGHFHTQSEAGNIKYLGTPYTLTLADADDKRGFWIFDTDTHEIEFVENPDCWHTKLYYDANTFDPKTIDSYANKNVKIIVETRSTDSREISFDVVEERIAKIAHACQTLDELDIKQDMSEDFKSVKDIDVYVGDYADTLDESTEVKDKVKAIFSSLRAEALENA